MAIDAVSQSGESKASDKQDACHQCCIKQSLEHRNDPSCLKIRVGQGKQSRGVVHLCEEMDHPTQVSQLLLGRGRLLAVRRLGIIGAGKLIGCNVSGEHAVKKLLQSTRRVGDKQDVGA